MVKVDIGRNSACSCGSGKKYKHCCKTAAEAQLAPRRLSNAAIPTALQAAAAHYAGGRYPAAEALCREIHEADPAQPKAFELRGLVEEAQGKLEQASTSLQMALALQPDDVALICHLARTLYFRKLFDAAIGACQRALSLQPDLAVAHEILAAALSEQGKSNAAADSWRALLALQPDNARIYNNLGLVLAAAGKHQSSLDNFRRAIALKPDYMDARSNLLYGLCHADSASTSSVYEEHVRFGDSVSRPEALLRVHHNARDRDRRLRIGFVSADLWNHPVAQFIEAIWAGWNAASLDIWVYHNNRHEDHVSARLKSLVHSWQPVWQMDDDALASQIEKDRIDILVDLSGHTGHNRLPVFARKPAPLQASWIGYPATTGMAAMDYYVADRHLAPLGVVDPYFTEKIVRLPAVSRFLPQPDAPPANQLPAIQKGFFTFGSFNRQIKLSDAALALWSRVLNAVPDSRMLLAPISDAESRQSLMDRFAQHGIAPERLAFSALLKQRDYLLLHHEVDLLLDTFPYSGGTTSAQAIWMGVPVLTLVGDTMYSRQTAAVLQPAGLAEFATESADAFVMQAVGWTRRLPELDRIRSGLRAALNQSPLMDAAPIARSAERAMRTMWQRWCDGLPPASFELAASP
jgi:protein O-GlcNAc transferase